MSAAPSLPHFLREAARILNAGQSRSLLISGNVDDLFPSGSGHVTLPELLREAWDVPGWMVLTYEINGPVRFQRDADRLVLRRSWTRWRTGLAPGDLALARLVDPSRAGPDEAQRFDDLLERAVGRPTVALEFLRQLSLCSRSAPAGDELARRNLLVIIEAADLVLPEAPVSSLGDADRQRLHILHDWFADPDFVAGDDAVVLLAESRAALSQRIMRLPQVLEVAAPDPDRDHRRAFVDAFCSQHGLSLVGEDREHLTTTTAGLTLQALRQLLLGIRHAGGRWSVDDVSAKVEAHLTASLGAGTVAFSRPTHSLDDVVGASRLKAFLRHELVPRLRAGGAAALAGAAVCGPIGAGKTFIFSAMAAELGVPVLELKNIRSQWFGQTDAILERLARALRALDRAVIVVDEADTQFGGVGSGTHDTERRLTGKVQAMMSDPELLGRVFWLLMTARIDQLSPDLRRPGRAGDLIIPVLDPDSDDRRDFVRWALAPAGDTVDDDLVTRMVERTGAWSAAGYAAFRRELTSLAARGGLDATAVAAVVDDMLPPPISAVRRRQTLLALTHCTRRSLLPNPEVSDEERAAWTRELDTLE